MEIVFRIDGILIPESVGAFHSISPSSIVSVGRRLHRSTLDYYGRMNNGDVFNVKYAEICSLLEVLSIQVNIRGKFIIQQSELLSGIRQRNTTLLEIIEESSGNESIIQRLSELEKKQSALYEQKESVKERVEEIERYENENKEMETMKNQSMELIEEMNELELNQQKLMVEMKVNEYALSTVRKEECEKRKRSVKEEIEENEKALREMSEEISTMVQEKVVKEKEGVAVRERLLEVQQESEKRRAVRRSERRKLKQIQEELIVNLDNQKQLSEKVDQMMNEVRTHYDMKRRYAK